MQTAIITIGKVNREKRMSDGITLLPLDNMYMYYSSFLFSFTSLVLPLILHTDRACTYILALSLSFARFFFCAYTYRFFTMTSLYIHHHSLTTPLLYHAADQRRGEESED
jgi:hypothetical protein